MSTASTIIPIRLETAPNVSASHSQTEACPGCLHSRVGPVCRVEWEGLSCTPQLAGPTEQVQRVMAALDSELALVDVHEARQAPLTLSGLVKSLTLAHGEAELTLAVSPRCGGAQLADAAFQTLRRLLPDTDIYIRHAG